MRTLPRASARVLSISLLAPILGTLALTTGCSKAWFQTGPLSGITGGTGITTTSVATGAFISPTFGTAVYRFIDENTADVYLTDIPLARLADESDTLSDVTGSIVHVHVFLTPKAGRTPIDQTATNATVRHVIFAGGSDVGNAAPAQGIYSGAGFVLTSTIGKTSLNGSIREVSARLSAGSPAFADALGPSMIRGSFSAALDDPASRTIAARVASLGNTLSAQSR
jgi:hypothetical protein